MKELKTANIETLKNKEEVRIYRLNKLEENQLVLIEKIDAISDKLDNNYAEHHDSVLKCKQRIETLEKRANKVDKLIWLIIGAVITETVALVFLLIAKTLLHL